MPNRAINGTIITEVVGHTARVTSAWHRREQVPVGVVMSAVVTCSRETCAAAVAYRTWADAVTGSSVGSRGSDLQTRTSNTHRARACEVSSQAMGMARTTLNKETKPATKNVLLNARSDPE